MTTITRTSPDDAPRGGWEKAFWRRATRAGLRLIADQPPPKRRPITKGRQAMLQAAIDVLNQYMDFWPLTLRQIHYRLLTRHVLRNTVTGS